MAEEATIEVDLGVEEGFSLGLQYGVMARKDLCGKPAEPCDGCNCGLADDDYQKVVLDAPFGDKPDTGFKVKLRDLLEEHFSEVDEDTLVGRVEVCADDVPVIYVRNDE